ncbi:MAG: M23 family metallopeptidase [Proteobacteria bacterium]|nr:M23 family metallopeptidase [Pseudomonadota bacterium]
MNPVGLRGRSRLVASSFSKANAEGADDNPKVGGERAALYADYRELEWPVEGYVSSGFGPRHGRTHAGIDIMSKAGRKIRSAHGGQVEFAGWKHGYGWTIVVKQRSYKTLYAHCSKLYVKRDQWVKKGQQIAQVGASGNAEGIHLHFEYKTLADRSMDPMPHFSRQYAH